MWSEGGPDRLMVAPLPLPTALTSRGDLQNCAPATSLHYPMDGCECACECSCCSRAKQRCFNSGAHRHQVAGICSLSARLGCQGVP